LRYGDPPDEADVLVFVLVVFLPACAVLTLRFWFWGGVRRAIKRSLMPEQYLSSTLLLLFIPATGRPADPMVGRGTVR
jgi:hypothetical protein